MTKEYTRYFIKYLNGQPMGTMHINHERTGYDAESDGDFTYDAPLLPYQKEMCKILLEQGWTETDFITEHDAYLQIINSVRKLNDLDDDVGLWRRQGKERRRREQLAECILYVDLINLAKKRLGMKYYTKEGEVVKAASHRREGS